MRNSADGMVLSVSELSFYLFFSLLFGMRMWGIYEGKPLYIPLLAVGLFLLQVNHGNLLSFICSHCLRFHMF